MAPEAFHQLLDMIITLFIQGQYTMMREAIRPTPYEMLALMLRYVASWHSNVIKLRLLISIILKASFT